MGVTAEVVNNSTRDVKPRFEVYVKKSYFGRCGMKFKRKCQTWTLLKDKDESVERMSRKTVCKTFCLPTELPPSILNCKIIKLEYRLKVRPSVCLSVWFSTFLGRDPPK